MRFEIVEFTKLSDIIRHESRRYQTKQSEKVVFLHLFNRIKQRFGNDWTFQEKGARHRELGHIYNHKLISHLINRTHHTITRILFYSRFENDPEIILCLKKGNAWEHRKTKGKPVTSSTKFELKFPSSRKTTFVIPFLINFKMIIDMI